MNAAPRASFSVLTLNLRFGLADDGANAWVHRRDPLRQFLATHASDFMLFQEANDFQIDFLAASLPDYNRIGQRLPAPAFWQNNIIFYRAPWQLDAWEHFFLSATPDIPSRFPTSRWPRQCTLGCFHAGSHELVCGSTHLDFEESVQVASAHIIRQRIDRLAAGRPAILGGDFNCEPDSACHGAFTQPPEPSGPQLPPFRNVLQAPFPGTFHGFQGGDGRLCIDWILYRGAVTVQRAGVIRFPAVGRYPSDHYPVGADFILKTSESAR